MSIRSLPADAVSEIEPEGTTVPVEPMGVGPQQEHSGELPLDESPDDGPPLSKLIADTPTTDDGKSALQYGSSRYERKRRMVAELLARGRDTVARRVASCGNNDYQCNKPHLCRLCHRAKRFDAKTRHASRVKRWENHMLIALTMPTTCEHPAVARTDVLDRFQTARRRSGFTEVVSGAFGGVHTVRDEERGEFRAHIDLLCDASETMRVRSELGDVWEDVGGGYVEATPVTAQSDGTHANAVEATTCYVVEKTDLSVSAQTDYATVRPDGSRHWLSVRADDSI